MQVGKQSPFSEKKYDEYLINNVAHNFFKFKGMELNITKKENRQKPTGQTVHDSCLTFN